MVLCTQVPGAVYSVVVPPEGSEVDACVRLRRRRSMLPGSVYTRFCPYEMVPAVGEGEVYAKLEHTGLSAMRMKPSCEVLSTMITMVCAYREAKVEVQVGTYVKLNNLLLTPTLARSSGYSAVNGYVGIVEHMVQNKAPIEQNISNCMRTMFMVRVAVAEGSAAKQSVDEANAAVFGGTPADWRCAQSVWVWVSAAQIEVTASPCSVKASLYPYMVHVNCKGGADNDFRTHSLAIRSQCREVSCFPRGSAMMEVIVVCGQLAMTESLLCVGAEVGE